MTITRLGRLILAIEAIILAGIVVHAPLTVWLGTVFPAADEFIKSWKELLMGLGFVLLVIYVSMRRVWGELWRDWVVRLSALYALIHLVLLAWMPQGVAAASAGIMIDLRYILFFIMVYVTAKYIVESRRVLIIAALIGAGIVLGFAALQLTLLPDDILKYIGYSKETITPYLTVDLNYDYVRINSTLRGPNPVGAYAGIALALTIAFAIQRRDKLTRNQGVACGLLAIGSVAALWASYSRSAVVAGILMVVIVASLSTVKRISRTWWIVGATVLLGVIGGLIAARDTAFVSNVILHENPAGGSVEKSNDGHADSLEMGVERMFKQPLGGGVGSTGSASLRGDTPVIIENQYLFIAHEVGWVGLGVFMALFGLILYRLWLRRDDWLALGLLASGIGLSAIGLLLPVWADDTVSIIWWGLAGLAIGYGGKRVYGKKGTRHKKTA